VLEAAVKEVLLEQDATFFEKYDEVRGVGAAAAAEAARGKALQRQQQRRCAATEKHFSAGVGAARVSHASESALVMPDSLCLGHDSPLAHPAPRLMPPFCPLPACVPLPLRRSAA